VADKAYSLHVDRAEYDSEEEGQAQDLCGLWLGTSGVDSGTDSEEDLSASSEMSDHASPVPDDTHCEYYTYIPILCCSTLLEHKFTATA
jgi:hypothetical protein